MPPGYTAGAHGRAPARARRGRAPPPGGQPAGVPPPESLCINPVQILENQEHRLHLAFAQQHTLERVERPLPPLRGIEFEERAVRGERVE